MCRNIKLLFNFDPPVTDSEARAACLQFVRKISGINKPSRANEASFQAAIASFSSYRRSAISSSVGVQRAPPLKTGGVAIRLAAS